MVSTTLLGEIFGPYSRLHSRYGEVAQFHFSILMGGPNDADILSNRMDEYCLRRVPRRHLLQNISLSDNMAKLRVRFLWLVQWSLLVLPKNPFPKAGEVGDSLGSGHSLGHKSFCIYGAVDTEWELCHHT